MDSTLVVAVTGFIVGVGGLLLNLKGQRDQQRQQTAATGALESKTRLDETQQALDATVARAERAETGERTKQTRIDALEDELDEQRQLHRSRLSAQEAVCRETTSALLDAAAALREVVVSEIARASVDQVVDEFRPHPHGGPRAIAPKPDQS